MSVQLPMEVQMKLDTYLRGIEQEIEANDKVPQSMKNSAWVYVANKAHHLALNGAFSQDSARPQIDYSAYIHRESTRDCLQTFNLI